MKIGLQKAGIREYNLKKIVESGKSKEGRNIIIGFLVSTGIIKRIQKRRTRKKSSPVDGGICNIKDASCH